MTIDQARPWAWTNQRLRIKINLWANIPIYKELPIPTKRTDNSEMLTAKLPNQNVGVI